MIYCYTPQASPLTGCAINGLIKFLWLPQALVLRKSKMHQMIFPKPIPSHLGNQAQEIGPVGIWYN